MRQLLNNGAIDIMIFASCFYLFSCQKQETPHAVPFSDDLTKDAVIEVTDAAIHWQMNEYENMNEHRRWKGQDVSWENAIFLTAVCEWSYLRNDTIAMRWVRNKAAANDYNLGKGISHIYHADNLIVGMLYADLYEQDGNVYDIHNTIARLQFIKNNPSSCNLYTDNKDKTYYYKQRWSWCDALFMAPQVFARYAQIWNDASLLEFMNREYWATTEYLMNKDYHLYWRDSNYFDKLEPNGAPVFWGRGNGWVFGGLARLIPYLPMEWAPRKQYVEHFQAMAEAIVNVQSTEGHWFVTMLDPQSYPSPEMSSTGFFTFALWWGLNAGILDEDIYLEPAKKGWKALVHAMHPNGMLGSVQAVGEKPEAITADMTEVYGSAAMAMAAMEILKWLDK